MCVDCTPDYKREMVAQCKCANPDIAFRVDDDGFIEGYRPPQTEWQKKAERIVARATRGVIAVFRQSGTLRTLELGSAQYHKQRPLDLVGVYGPGANVDTVAEDLKAAA